MYAVRGKSDKFHNQILDDLEKTRKVILDITEQEEILDKRKVIQNSIVFRNVFTYPLNLLQIELLKRWDETENRVMDKNHRQALFMRMYGYESNLTSHGVCHTAGSSLHQ